LFLLSFLRASRKPDPAQMTTRKTPKKVGRSETPLRRWMAANQITFRQMSVMLGCPARDVVRVVTNARMPTLILALRIEHVTRGGVRVHDWLNTVLGRQLWHSADDPTHREWLARKYAEENERNIADLKRRHEAQKEAWRAGRRGKETGTAPRGECGEGHSVRAGDDVPPPPSPPEHD
jgi:plasmid maintenance system antidote protein VapI